MLRCYPSPFALTDNMIKDLLLELIPLICYLISDHSSFFWIILPMKALYKSVCYNIIILMQGTYIIAFFRLSLRCGVEGSMYIYGSASSAFLLLIRVAW